MKSLKELDCSEPYHWCDPDLIVLTDVFPCLEDLKITSKSGPQCPAITDNGVEILASKLKGLKKIGFSGCGKITDQSLKSLSSNCIHLTSIWIHDFPKGLVAILRGCPSLQIFQPGVQWLTDKSMVEFSQHLRGLTLQDLRMKGCHHLTNEGIAEFLRICPDMEHLNVSQLNVSEFLGSNDDENKLKLKVIYATGTKIDDANMQAMGKRCPNLEELDILECRSVSNCGVKELVSNCEKLRKINLRKCGNVSTELLDRMVKSRPSLKQIIPPRDFVPTDEQKKLFFQNGCRLLFKDHFEILS